MIRKSNSFTLTCMLASVFIAGSIGCGYREGGQGWKDSSETWVSTEFRPTTLTLLDARSGGELWQMDIPVGYQVVTHFISGGGTDKVNLPDRLEYQVFLDGTPFGKLRSAIAVPDANSRCWKLTLRDAPEYPKPGVRNGLLGNSPPLYEPQSQPLPDLNKDDAGGTGGH